MKAVSLTQFCPEKKLDLDHSVCLSFLEPGGHCNCCLRDPFSSEGNGNDLLRENVLEWQQSRIAAKALT